MPESPAITPRPAVVTDTSHSPYAVLRPVPIDAITLTDTFWAPRLAINRDVTLASQFRQLEETGCLDNFRRLAGTVDAPQRGPQFADSDAYKWLEAASSALAGRPDAALEAMVDTLATAFEGAQRPDGYLNTYFAGERADQRWTTISGERNWMHELYCAGHFFQAAVAHYRATGSERLLNVAIRYADHISETFGPAENQRHGVDGHPEVEMGLVELYRATGDRRYLDSAIYFLETRRGMDRMNDCWQEMKPFRELTRMQAHAVCAVYLTSGATDIYAETGDEGIKSALDKLWTNMTEKQLYITGGIGQRYQYEAFGRDYELPLYAYAETCAAIGSIMWNWRLLGVTGDSKFADLIEQTLYNGFLSGLSLDGEHYFYTNPLTDEGEHRRQPWFGCACCPPNVARMLAQLPGYFYSTNDVGDVFVNLYAAGSATIALPGGGTVVLTQTTDYPWDGEITLTIDAAPETPFSINLRVPAWGEGATISVNGDETTETPPGQYTNLKRSWASGDTVTLTLPMPVRKIVGHPAVEAIRGKTALMRGPIVYCIEQVDNPDVPVSEITMWASSKSGGPRNHKAEFHSDMLDGVVLVHVPGLRVRHNSAIDALYRPVDAEALRLRHAIQVTAIPYFAWANREAGPMRVWLPIY